MKKSLFLLLALCMTVFSLQAQKDYTTVSRFAGEKISEIDASGAWNIQLTQGNATKVELTFPERFKDQLELTLNEGELKIRFRGNVNSKTGETFKAVIVCSSLREIDLSGACRVDGTGPFSSETMKFDLSGAAKVDMNGIVTVGSELKIDLSGASRVMCRNITTQRFDMEMSGASQVELAGKAMSGKCEVSGAAKFNMSEFEVKRVDVELSGAVSGHLKVTEQVSGEMSGASKLVYAGGASGRVNVSGAANLKHQ